MSKRLLFAAAFTLLLLKVGAVPAHAAESGSICTLKDGLVKLFAAEQAGSSELQLDARKGLLYIAADCSREETLSALKDLGDLKLENKDLISAKDQLIQQLEAELTYTDSQKARVPDVGLRGTRDIALTLKEWRATTHLPQVGNANNFSLWLKNQNFLTVAELRAKQIQQTLHNLKLADQDAIKTLVDEASGHLDEATAANQKAEAQLSRLESAQYTAQTLRTSFNALSAAYDSFFKISEAVKKIVPF